MLRQAESWPDFLQLAKFVFLQAMKKNIYFSFISPIFAHTVNSNEKFTK
jgi:hypothetical protein